MAERATLVTELRVDDQLTGKLGAAKAQLTQLDATARKAGASVGGLGSSLGGIAKAGVVAFAAFKAVDLASDFFVGGIKGAIEEEAGIKRLTASLKANVPAWDGATAAIERTIKARQDLGFADDEQRDALARTVAATRNVAQAQAIVATAMDLARFKSIDLASATDALIKIEGGQFRALKGLGIELRANATQTEALAAVQAVAAGQAQAYSKETAGALAAAGVAVDELGEDFGALAAGPIADVARGLKDDLIPGLREAADEAGKFAGKIGEAIGPVTDLASAIDREGDPLSDSLNLFLELGPAIHNFVVGTTEAERAAAKAGDATLEWVKAERALLGDMSLLVPAIKELGVDLLLSGGAADDAGANLRHFAGDVRGLTQDINDATRALAHFKGEAVKVPAQGARTQDFDPTHPGGAPAGLHGAAAKAAAAAAAARLNAVRGTEIAADNRLANAKRRAEDEARTYEKALGKAFDNAKSRANSLFDTLHNRHVQAIRDAETLAEKQHAGALKVIADTLKAAQLANAAPVTAAEKALAERQQAQSRRGLVESLSAAQVAAQTNTDPEAAADLARALRNATEALQNFDDAAKIARLTTVQETADRLAGLVAGAKTLAADKALNDAKAQAQKALDAETIANAKRTRDFEAALTRLEAASLKAKDTPAEQQAAIAKLERQFGITTDPVTGFHHITDPLITAIKNIPPSVVNVTFNPVFNAVFQVGARAVAAALASQSSPTSTPMVRTGAAGRS